MGKVLIKQGFLGLGRPIEKWFCDKCGAECRNQYWKEQQVFCRTCANALDPEIVHNWTSDELVRKYKENEFFHDTSDGTDRYVEQCLTCLSLLVVARSAGSFRRYYYQLKSSSPTESTFPCIEHTGYDDQGNIRIHNACAHDFVIVGTSKRLDAEAHAKYEHMMSHRNPMLEGMYGTDHVDIQYHCFGATHYWCWKCGLHHRLNPQREHLLPTKGQISA